jgi:hypothetical protein
MKIQNIMSMSGFDYAVASGRVDEMSEASILAWGKKQMTKKCSFALKHGEAFKIDSAGVHTYDLDTFWELVDNGIITCLCYDGDTAFYTRQEATLSQMEGLLRQTQEKQAVLSQRRAWYFERHIPGIDLAAQLQVLSKRVKHQKQTINYLLSKEGRL